MSKYRLRYYGDPVLRQQCAPIEEITDEIREIAAAMVEICFHLPAAGLAAPQVGALVRMFVLRNYIIMPDGYWTQSPPVFYINPKVLWKSQETDTDTEGCLSIPKLNVGPIERPIGVKVEALDLEGKRFVEEREGLNARVFFHENDHLNGVLHIDRLPPSVKKRIEPQLLAIKHEFRSK